MRPSHHPNCALSQDAADSLDDNVKGYRAPKCTCRQWRKKRKAVKHREGRQGAYLPDGITAIGPGNYRRTPLSSE